MTVRRGGRSWRRCSRRAAAAVTIYPQLRRRMGTPADVPSQAATGAFAAIPVCPSQTHCSWFLTSLAALYSGLMGIAWQCPCWYTFLHPCACLSAPSTTSPVPLALIPCAHHFMALQAVCTLSPAGHQARVAAALLCHVSKCVLPLAHAHLPSRRLRQLRRGQQVCLLQVLQAALPRCTGARQGFRGWHALNAQHSSCCSARACMLQQAAVKSALPTDCAVQLGIASPVSARNLQFASCCRLRWRRSTSSSTET